MNQQVSYDPFSLSNSKKESTSKKKDSYTPTEEERKLVKKCNDLLDKAKSFRSKYDEKWPDYYKMFRGKQWKEKRPSYRHSEVINLIFQTIQSIVPILTDAKPKFEYIATEPGDYQFAEIINQVSEWDWVRNNWMIPLTEVIYDGHIFGTGPSRIFYDPNGDQGIGSIVYESTDVFYNFPDPNATSPNTKCNYYIIAEPMDLCEIKRLYPEKGKYVKADVQNLNYIDRSEPKDIKYKSPSESVVYTDYEQPQASTQREQALLITLFIKDDTYEEEEKVNYDEQGTEVKSYIQKLKYPQGRMVQIAGNVVLKDTENYMDDGSFPIQCYVNYINPRQFWGLSEIEQLESPQRLFNKLLSFALDVTMLMGNPIFIVDSNAGVDTDNLINRPGLVVEKNPGSEVRREMGVQLQPHVLEMISRMKMWFDEVAGSNDVTRGIRPEGVNAALAIQELQQAAQTRIRLKSRNLDAYLQDLGKHYLTLIMEFYSVPRIVRLTNKDDPKLNEYFKFVIEKEETEEGDIRKVLRRNKYIVNEDGSIYEGEQEVYHLKSNLDVRVTTGSSLPFSKAEKESRLLNLFDRGIIDSEEVLKNLDYPNYQALLDRLQQKQAAMAATQA
jgi:hypothetical protein